MATEHKNKQRSLTSKQAQIAAPRINSENPYPWVAVYFDSKFHLTTPSNFDKLRKIQLQISQEKLKLQHNNGNNKNNSKDKDSVNESKQDIAKKPSREQSLQSARSRQCKTEINQIKAQKQKAEIQKQLVQEEENYKTKIYQTSQNRRQLRQSAAFVIRSKKEKSIEVDRNSKKKSNKNFMIAPHELTSNRKMDQSVSQSVDKSKKSEVNLKQQLQPVRIQYMTIQVQSSQNKEPKLLEDYKTINVNESQRYNQNQNHSSKQKSFIISTRKIASSNGKYSQKSQIKNDGYQKQKVKSKQQIQRLTSKLREMQQKLQKVEERQKQLQEAEKQKNIRGSRQKSRTSSKLNKSVKSGLLQIGVDSKMVEKSEVKQGQKKSDNKIEDQKSLAGKLKEKRMLKLAINNQIIKYNLNEDLQRQKQQQQEINKKQKMEQELSELRKMIRLLKIDKIKQQALIKQLQFKTSDSNNADITFNGTESKATSSDKGDILFSFKPNMLQESDRERVDQIGKIHDQKYFFKGQERKVNRRVLKPDAIRRSEQFRFSQDFRSNEEIEEFREEYWQNPEDEKNSQEQESMGMRKGKIVKQLINVKKFEVEIENSVASKEKSVRSRDLDKQMGIQQKYEPFTNIQRQIQKPKSLKGSAKGEGSSVRDKAEAEEEQKINKNQDEIKEPKQDQSKIKDNNQNQQEILNDKNSESAKENKKEQIKQVGDQQEKVKEASIKEQQKKQGEPKTIKQPQVDLAEFFKPDINVPQFQIPEDFIIPDLPTSPLAQSSQIEVISLAKKICDMFQIKLKNTQQLQYKKYKNCVILKNTQNKAIVWHYSGKFYVGGWKETDSSEGCKEGEGFEYIPGKHYYRGQFKQGKRQGKGKMLLLNGNIYMGDFTNGERNGIGIFLEKSSNICYKGEWKQGKRDGRGIMKISNKQFYDGQFTKNSKTGFGLEVFPNGDLYIGQYKNGQFSGKGKYFWKNGSAYVGQFIQGQREGHGKWISSLNRGDLYVGYYKKDKKSGKGKYIWDNGSTFEGQFVADLKHGEGMVVYEDGKIIKGVWEHGKLKSVEKLKNNEIEEIDESIQIQQRIRPNVPRIYQSPSKKMQSSKWIQGV